MARISSAVCCFTEAIAGGMAGPGVEGLGEAFSLRGKAAPAVERRESREGIEGPADGGGGDDVAAVGGSLGRESFSSKSSGSSSIREDDMVDVVLSGTAC